MNPWTRDDVVSAVERVHAESRTYWESFTPDSFLAALNGAWSPADNVRHLTKSVRPVAMALRLPRLFLRLRFGPARAASRTYEAIVQTYLGKLAEGATAGRFAPSPLPPQADAQAARVRILAEHAAAVAALVEASSRWAEKDLDRYRLPHPLLGMLTVREMLFFTLYHNQHHVAVVRRRDCEDRS